MISLHLSLFEFVITLPFWVKKNQNKVILSQIDKKKLNYIQSFQFYNFELTIKNN